MRRAMTGLGATALLLLALLSSAAAQSFYWPAGPPRYAAQAVTYAAATGGALTLPAGLTWSSAPFSGPNGGTAVIDFAPPSGDAFDCAGPPLTGTASGSFVAATVVSCSSGTIEFQVVFGSAAVPTAGVLQLGAFRIAGTSGGLVVLAAINPPAAPANCSAPSASCNISALVKSTSNQGISTSKSAATAIMAESANAATSVVTAAPADGAGTPVCIDVFSYHSNGEAFQQPCVAGTPGSAQPLADLGSIAFTQTYLLGSDGVHAFAFQNATVTVTMTGTCAGSAALGSGAAPASCGLLPLTGEAVYLVPEPSPPTAPCPATAAAAAAAAGAIPATVAPPAASFAGVAFPNATPSSVLGTTGTLSYEVCGYALGNQVVGAVAAWAVKGTIDFGLPDAITATDAANALLTYGYNGAIDSFNLTKGGWGYEAFLRVVNTNPWTPLNLGVNGEEVVCLIQGDDGSNGYASLYTNSGETISNSNTSPGNPALPAGQNTFYSIATLFINAGITPSATNPFMLGALTCFHDFKLTLTQVWEEPGGTIINMD